MAAAFNLTAEINLRGPSNLNRVVSDIRRQLSTVSLNLNINPNATRGIQAATGQVQGLSAALQTANANATNLTVTLRNLGAAISGASSGMNTLAGGLNNIGRQTTNIQANVGAATSSMEEFGRQSALAVRRFAAFSVATGGIYALVKAISSGYNEFLTFNKELVRLQQVTGATSNGLKGITDEITRLATGFGVTSSELLTVSSTLAQAGLNATQTKTALEALAKSALAPSFDNLNDTVEGSIALMRQFGISAGDLESSLGSINAVAAAFAVESGDIIKAIQRTGGVFANASKGISEGKDALNEFIALFTSVRATTRESAETIATGLRTIFTRVQRGGTIQALKEYGITLTDLEGKFVGPFEAVKRLSEGLKSLDPRDLRFSQIVEELGGFRQIGKVIPLIQQFATSQQALAVAQRGAGSLAEAAGTAQLSLANKITKVREEFVALIRDIGQSQSFQTFADISLKLASALISVASAAKEVLPALAALAAIRSIPAIGQFVGGFGRGLIRRHEGGPVRAFASGGFVPGSGDRDTVPAMLTPGEFVIRKKAVKSIGLNRLHSMNKFASGGKVPKFADGGYSDEEWMKEMESIRRKYKLPLQSEIDRMSPAEKAAYEDRLGQIAFSSPSPGREKKAIQAMQQKAARKSKLGLFFSAAGLKRGPKASPGMFEQTMLKYQGSVGMTSIKPKFIAWGKGQGSFDDVVKGSEDKIRSQLSGVQLENFNKLLTTKTLSNYLSSGGKMGHIPPLKKAIYQIMGVTGKNVGGFIQKFRNGREVKGLDPKLASRVKEAGGFENLISKNMMGSDGVYNFGLVSLRSGTSKGSRIENRQIGNTGKKARIHIGNLSDKQQYDNIEKNITSSLKSVINSTGKSLASSLGSSSASGVERKKILSGAVLSSATGSIFEAALQMVGAPYIDKIESIKSMDFPFGLGPAASLFGSFPSDVPTDATRTVGGSGKGISDFVGQINRFLGAVDKKSFTKSLSPKIGTYTATDLLGRVSRNPKDRDSINNILSTFGLPNIGPRNKLTAATSNNLNKALSTNRTLLDQLLAAGLLSGKAGGGSISGEDTVPALLTPGEFVINKKAAKKIGSAKLNKLNKADKIQGFNKGGSVGNIQNFAGGGGVQRFFVGGLVQMFTGLTRSVGQLIPIFGNLASTTAATTRNMAAQQVATFRQQGLSGAALKNAMVNAGYGPGGVNNMRTRNQMTQMATQRASTAQAQGQGGGGLGMGLMFVGPMIAEAINSAITSGGGPISKAVGSSITSVISGITVGAAFGPWGMLVGAVAGAGSAILNWTKTLQAAETVEKEKIIENKSQSLEKSFERLAKEVDKVEIGKIQDSIIADIQAILAAQQTVSSNTISAVEPSTLGRMMGYKIDTTALSKDLSQAASVAGVNIQRYIEYGMSRGQNFDELLGKFGDTGRESLAITRAGPELTLLKALAQEARSSGNRQRYGDENLSAVELEDKYRQRIAEINDEFKKAAVEQQAAQKNLNAVVIAVDHFAVAIKKLESVIGRAGAEFEEAQRRMDISFGTMLGEEAKIAAPSRMNENILQNPAAYTAEEISSAIRDLGQNLQFSPDFTKQLETATISKSVIQAGLPKILAEAAAAQKAPGGGGLEGASETAIRDKLEELFRNVPGMNAGDAAEASSKLFESIQNRLESNKDISLSELSTNDPALNKIMEGYNNTVDAAAKAQSEYNQILSQVNSRLNQYVSALERASEAQNQAAIVRTEGQNRLTEALGGELSLQELNKTFEDTLLTLTSRIGGNGLAIRGTGTTDADAISRRLRIESDRLKTLQSQKVPAAGTAAFDKYNRDLANATLSVRNLTKAQEKLATDTTRASNALSKIQSIRQAQESRRGTFDEVLKNLNNPEWMMQFVRQVESLQRVQTGRGNIMDIGPALDALQQRLAGMADAGEREAERTKFYNNIARILERAGMNRADIDNAMRLIGNRGEEPELANAIDQYTQAIQQQAAAIEAGGVLTRTSAQDFYTEIMRAANDFVARVGQAGAQPAAGQVEASKGGLIYASKGQLINYQPKGTDTVPAMLTPGEFVVNKKATQKNLGLLKSINSGSTVVSQNGVAYARTGGQILDGLRGDSYLLQNLDGQSVTGSSASDRKIGERNRKAANDIKDRMLDSMKELNNKILSTAGPDDDTLFKDIFTNTNFFKTTDPTIIRFLPTPQFNDWRSSISEALLRARDLLLSDLIDNKNGSLLAQPTTTSGQPLPQNPNQPSNQNKNIPSPDYYDELTYKEYLDKLVRSRNEPQPPIRSKFTTDAFYTKTGIDRVVGKQTKQDILDKLYNEHGSNYEFFRDNIKNNIWPERAILDSAYRQQLIAAAENFENYLNFEGIPIPAPYENIETLGSSARITAFDSRLTGPINGGPSNLADLDKLKEFGTMFEAYVNGSARDVRDYLLLKNKDNADPEAIKALANNIKTNYEGAINSLKNITELTRIFKNGKNIVPNDSGKDIGLNSLVGQLKNYVKPSYKTSLTEIGQENFNFDDSLLDVFESKYAQMIEQNAQGSADPVRGKDIVSGMTSQERDNIRGRKSARSQYESSLIYYKYARGKYNRQSMLDQRRAAYLDPSVGRPQMLNSGGVVYANNGQLINFQPRGTDTVPAMLTPGEFVVNARAAKNNLGLLQNINNGGKKYSRGGVVYLQEGGFAGLSDSELKILELAKISPESIVEFSQNDALSDKKSFEFFKDLERQLNERNFKTVRTTGEPSSNFDPADFGDGINPTATLISAARESLPTIAATLVGLGTTTMMSSPAAGPGAPAVAGVGAVLAGIGSAIAAYMLTKEAQGVLIEDQIKTSEGTLRDTLNKIAAENPVSTAVGGAIPGIAAGGVPQLGKSAIAQGLTGAGISSTVTVGRKLMENNLQFDTADMVDILSSAVPGSNVANLGDNLYRTIAPAIAALPIIATTRNSSKAASKLRTPAGFLDIAGQSQRAIENWNNTDIISKLRLLGLKPPPPPGGLKFDKLNSQQQTMVLRQSGIDIDEIKPAVAPKLEDMPSITTKTPKPKDPASDFLKGMGQTEKANEKALIDFYAKLSPDQRTRILGNAGTLPSDQLSRGVALGGQYTNLNDIQQRAIQQAYESQVAEKSGATKTPSISGLTDSAGRQVTQEMIDAVKTRTKSRSAKKAGFTGWKTRILQKTEPDIVAIGQWLDQNVPEGRWKYLDNLFTVYFDSGNKADMDALSKKVERDLSQYVKFGEAIDSGDMVNESGLSARFDIEDISPNSDIMQAIREQRKGKLAAAYKMFLDSNPSMDIFGKGYAGKSGIPGTNFASWLLTQQKNSKDTKLQKFYEDLRFQELNIIDRVLASMVPEYTGKSVSASQTPKPLSTATNTEDVTGRQTPTTAGQSTTILDQLRKQKAEVEKRQASGKETLEELLLSKAEMGRAGVDTKKKDLFKELLPQSSEGRVIFPLIDYLRMAGTREKSAMIKSFQSQNPNAKTGELYGVLNPSEEFIKWYNNAMMEPLASSAADIKSRYDRGLIKSNKPFGGTAFNQTNSETYWRDYDAKTRAIPDEEYVINQINTGRRNENTDLAPIFWEVVESGDIYKLAKDPLEPNETEAKLIDAALRIRNHQQNAGEVTNLDQEIQNYRLKIREIETELRDIEKQISSNTPTLRTNPPPPPRRPPPPPIRRQNGGLIYASKGQLIPYEPKGTDTVPAMLTPGEFVVNAKATRQNLGLLKAINGGAKGYSKGGVAYLQDGGKYPKLGGGRTDNIVEADQSNLTIPELIAVANETNQAAVIARQIAQIRLDSMGIDWKNPQPQAQEAEKKDGGVPAASSEPPINTSRLRSLRDELKQYKDKEKRKAKYRQGSTSGPYPLIRDIGGILKQIKTTPPGFNSDSWRSQIREITETSSGQIAVLSTDGFVSFIDDIDRATESALRMKPVTAAQPLQPSVFPGGQNQVMTNPSVAASAPATAPTYGPALPPATSSKIDLSKTGSPLGRALVGLGELKLPDAGDSGPQPLAMPKYYDELTYKEWLDSLIDMSWAKFESGKYDEMPGPMPPEQARFVTPALYYDKDQANDPNADVKIKAQQKAEEWKKQYEGWRDYILKARQAGNNPPIPLPDGGASSAEQEESWLSNFESWASGYMQIPQEEIRAVMANAKMRLGFPARSTAYDTRYTGGLVGDPRQTSAAPGNLPQEEILKTATALKAEIDNAQKEYQIYSEKKAGPQPQTKEDAEVQAKALEVSAKSYTDAIGFLTELSAKTNVFRRGYQSFETNLGRDLNISGAIGGLRKLKQNIVGEGKNIDIDDSIIDTYFSNRARIVEQNAPEDLVDPEKPELGTQLPDKPIRGKDLGLTEQERKSIRGAKGPLSQYKSSLVYYKYARGKYNRDLMLAQRRLAYNQEKQRRRDEFNSPNRGRDAQGMATGGVVYAQQGQLINYQPRGTDTVPAMLTPGEFVVNKKATKENLGLLRSINDNKNKAPIKFMSRGGIIQPNYYQRAGSVTANNTSSGGVSVSLDTAALNQSFAKFDQSVQSFGGIADRFNGVASSISQALGGLDGVKQAFDSISGAVALLSGTTSGFANAIGTFNSTVTRLSNSIGDIPDSISLRVSGSIPVNVTVTVNGGEGLEDKLEPFKREILNEVSSKLNSATNGRLRVDFFTSTG